MDKEPDQVTDTTERSLHMLWDHMCGVASRKISGTATAGSALLICYRHYRRVWSQSCLSHFSLFFQSNRATLCIAVFFPQHPLQLKIQPSFYNYFPTRNRKCPNSAQHSVTSKQKVLKNMLGFFPQSDNFFMFAW